MSLYHPDADCTNVPAAHMFTHAWSHPLDANSPLHTTYPYDRSESFTDDTLLPLDAWEQKVDALIADVQAYHAALGESDER